MLCFMFGEGVCLCVVLYRDIRLVYLSPTSPPYALKYRMLIIVGRGVTPPLKSHPPLGLLPPLEEQKVTLPRNILTRDYKHNKEWLI